MNIYDLIEKCQNAEIAIRDELGVHSASSSDPDDRTVETEWIVYSLKVITWIKQNGVLKLSPKNMGILISTLTDENWHDMASIIEGTYYPDKKHLLLSRGDLVKHYRAKAKSEPS